MRRWHARVEDITHRPPLNLPDSHSTDEVYAFIQSVYHMKDWIKNDPALPNKITGAVEKYINKTRCLGISADICNASKHATLTTSRSNESPDVKTRSFGLGLMEGLTPAIYVLYQITADGGSVGLHTFAQECLDAWDAFLRQHGLL
jgi:hypothetical protein